MGIVVTAELFEWSSYGSLMKSVRGVDVRRIFPLLTKQSRELGNARIYNSASHNGASVRGKVGQL